MSQSYSKNILPVLLECVRDAPAADGGQIWSIVAQLWSTLSQMCPSLAKLASFWAEIGRCRPKLAHIWSSSARMPESARFLFLDACRNCGGKRAAWNCSLHARGRCSLLPRGRCSLLAPPQVLSLAAHRPNRCAAARSPISTRPIAGAARLTTGRSVPTRLGPTKAERLPPCGTRQPPLRNPGDCGLRGLVQVREHPQQRLGGCGLVAASLRCFAFVKGPGLTCEPTCAWRLTID